MTKARNETKGTTLTKFGEERTERKKDEKEIVSYEEE